MPLTSLSPPIPFKTSKMLKPPLPFKSPSLKMITKTISTYTKLIPEMPVKLLLMFKLMIKLEKELYKKLILKPNILDT